jgi:3-hydroxybutyrate dehydrogenase
LDMDVTSRESVTSTFANAKSKFGSISVLINNAGQARSETFEKSTLELLTELMSINLHSVYNCSQEVLEDMRAQKFGRIINVSSTAGLIGYSYTSAYCASKHAVIGLSKSLALELAKTGITVNNICPGFTDTPLVQDAIKNISKKTKITLQDSKNSLTKFNPMNRLIDPVEIANTALWLASVGASAITGQCISVSGGEVMV